MTFKVGDVCRVNEEYMLAGDKGVLQGSIVQIERLGPRRFTHKYTEHYAKILFSSTDHTDEVYMFYDNEIDLITGEPYND